MNLSFRNLAIFSSLVCLAFVFTWALASLGVFELAPGHAGIGILFAFLVEVTLVLAYLSGIRAEPRPSDVVATKVPAFSALNDCLRTAYFYDCHAIRLPPDSRSPLELYLSVFSRTPGWVDFLMNVRNKVAARLGLKDMGSLSSVEPDKPVQSYRIGDQIGIFKLLEIHAHEVILGETDKHLDVKVSVAKQDQPGYTVVSVSTVVHVHNFMGRLYMFFVAPAHRIIAPATVSKLALPSN
jgi:hypothetical protein